MKNSIPSQSRAKQFNKIQRDQSRYYEQDFVVLVNHLQVHNIMPFNQVAKLLGLSRQVITRRVNRYRQESDE